MNDSTTSFDVYFTINNDPSNAIYRETYEHKNTKTDYLRLKHIAKIIPTEQLSVFIALI